MKASLLREADRLTLVQVVLAAMTIYIMMAMDMPKWMITEIERLCRGFLWCGKDKASGGVCAVAWEKVCRPKQLGGLGLCNLNILNDPMRMRWLWISKVAMDKPWLHTHLDCTNSTKALFDASLKVQISNGESCLFWPDNWIEGKGVADLAPDLLNFFDARGRATTTVAQGVTENGWINDILGRFIPPYSGPGPDRLAILGYSSDQHPG